MENVLSDIILGDSLVKIKEIENSSVNLILTDPPYIISKDSGMEEFYHFIQNK